MAEKMFRVKLIGEYIGKKINLSSSELADFDRAADIYKFDLVTNMVGEFAELQGIMGTHYAELAGERKAVSQAIKESYLPSSADGDLPITKIGSLLSIADKLDTIIAFFGAGMIPNSSNDPYALRRSAYGIVRILINQSWNISIEYALKDIIALLKGKTVAKLPNDEATQACLLYTSDAADEEDSVDLGGRRIIKKKKKKKFFFFFFLFFFFFFFFKQKTAYEM